METKEDLRIVKTKKIIHDTFFELIKEKGYNQVTISDIASRACINRNTFYLHYKDKGDLIKKIINDEYILISNKIEFDKDGNHYLNLKTLEESHIKWMFTTILKQMSSKIEMYRIIIDDPDLNLYLRGLYIKISNRISKMLDIKGPIDNIVFQYSMGGMISIIEQWIRTMPASENETAKILALLAYQNIQNLKQLENQKENA